MGCNRGEHALDLLWVQIDLAGHLQVEHVGDRGCVECHQSGHANQHERLGIELRRLDPRPVHGREEIEDGRFGGLIGHWGSLSCVAERNRPDADRSLRTLLSAGQSVTAP
jgi:hypothetical protein